MSVWKGRWSNGWLKSCTERVCIMNIRVVCFPASSSCIGTELAASVTENVESRKCDFRAVFISNLSDYCAVLVVLQWATNFCIRCCTDLGKGTRSLGESPTQVTDTSLIPHHVLTSVETVGLSLFLICAHCEPLYMAVRQRRQQLCLCGLF